MVTRIRWRTGQIDQQNGQPGTLTINPGCCRSAGAVRPVQPQTGSTNVLQRSAAAGQRAWIVSPPEFTSFPLTVLIKALKVAKSTAWP